MYNHNVRPVGVPTVRRVSTQVIPTRANTVVVRERVYTTLASQPEPKAKSLLDKMPDKTVERIIRRANINPDHKIHWERYSITGEWPRTRRETLGCVLEHRKTGKRELWTVDAHTYEPIYLCPWH